MKTTGNRIGKLSQRDVISFLIGCHPQCLLICLPRKSFGTVNEDNRDRKDNDYRDGVVKRLNRINREQVGPGIPRGVKERYDQQTAFGVQEHPCKNDR